MVALRVVLPVTKSAAAMLLLQLALPLAMPVVTSAPVNADAAVAMGAASVQGLGPCDIYARGKTPCVAAHSMTRALYAAYDGSVNVSKRPPVIHV